MALIYFLAFLGSIGYTATLFHFIWKISPLHSYLLLGFLAIQFVTSVLVELTKK